MRFDFNKIFQVLTIIAMVYVILILNTMLGGKAIMAQSGAPNVVPADIPSFPIKLTNFDQFSSKSISAFPVNKENQFVVVDSQNRTIVFYEIAWNGPSASIQVKTHTSY